MTTKIFEQILKLDKDGNIVSKIAILKNIDTKQLNKDLIKYCKKESREYKKELKRIDKGESNPSGEEFKKLMQNYRYSRTLENDLNDLLDTMGKEDWLLFKFHEDSLDMLDAEKLMFSQK